MKVVGITGPQEVYLASSSRNFRMNEYLMVEDPVMGSLAGEVVMAQTYNRFIPMAIHDEFVDQGVLESLQALGFQVDEETIYMAKLRLFREAEFPVETGSDAREPVFDEVRELILHGSLPSALALGEIKHSEALAQTMDHDLQGLFSVLDKGAVEGQRGVPYLWDLRRQHQYPHMGIFGASGSGKSFGMRVILEELMKKNMPTVVLDPHNEMDFSDDAFYRERQAILRVGMDTGVSFEELTVGDLTTLLEAAGELTDNMKNAIASLFRKGESIHAFRNRIEDLQVGLELGSEGLQKALDEAPSLDEQTMWKRRIKLFHRLGRSSHEATLRALNWRLGRLEREGLFGFTIDPITEALMVGKLVVLQGETKLLAIFATYLFRRLYTLRREYRDLTYRGLPADYFPPFFLVTDEAHNFAPKALPTPTKSVLREIAQEGRKYGTYLILATQRPALLDDTINAQLNTKMVFRIVRAPDIDIIRAETDLSTEDAKRLPHLQTGDVFISSAAAGRTNYVRIRMADTKSPHGENPFDEWLKHAKAKEEDLLEALSDFWPIDEGMLLPILQALEQKGMSMTLDTLKGRLQDLVTAGLVKEEKGLFGNVYRIE